MRPDWQVIATLLDDYADEQFEEFFPVLWHRRMPPRFCLRNALRLNDLHGLAVVIGTAKLPDPDYPLQPVEHAWVSDGGRSYEATWPRVGIDYRGVSLPGLYQGMLTYE
jgi:hypothetical protein